MKRISARLRSADPACSLPPLPDARAERDLHTLQSEQLTEAPQRAPERAAGTGPERAWTAAVVTIVLVVGIVAVSAWAIGLGRPVEPAGVSSPPPPVATPAAGLACHPADVAPFECGTYRSNYGAKTITGDAGGPAKDALTISFSGSGGTLVLRAVSPHCFDATIPVKTEPSRPAP